MTRFCRDRPIGRCLIEIDVTLCGKAWAEFQAAQPTWASDTFRKLQATRRRNRADTLGLLRSGERSRVMAERLRLAAGGTCQMG
jgi:hypothetical protein